MQLDAEDEAWLQSFVGMTAQTNEGLMGRYRLLGNLVSHLSAKRDGIEEIQQLPGLAIRCAKMDIRDEDAAIIAHGASCIVRPAVRVQEKL